MTYKTELKDFQNLSIKEILNKVQQNAWYGKDPSDLLLSNGIDTVELGGNVIESGYEYFTTYPYISLNNEILYEVETECVEPYLMDVSYTGKFENLDDAIDYLEDYLKDKKMVLTDKELSKNDSLEY